MRGALLAFVAIVTTATRLSFEPAPPEPQPVAHDEDPFAAYAFGEPCPIEGCTDHWASFTPSQRAELGLLLHEVAARNVRRQTGRGASVRARALGDEVLDWEIEGRSLAKDYYVQIDRLLAKGGYDLVVDRLRHNLEKR